MDIFYSDKTLKYDRSSVVNTERKQRRGFKPGQSGNPSGRPKGARNRATLATEALLQGEAEEVTRTCIERAKGGDSTALRLVMERILPPMRERTIRIDLPTVASVADLPAALCTIMQAVAGGEISPGEGSALCTMLGPVRHAFEAADLGERMDEIERRLSAEPRP
jgi:hypothetical protein